MENSQWIVVGVGAGAFILGIIFIVMGVLSRRKLTAIRETPTVKADQACRMADPTGSKLVEITGNTESPTPLTAPAGGREVLYYRHKVERMERRRVTDSSGNERWEENWRTVRDDKQDTSFIVKDETGQVWVNPDGADFVPELIMNDQPGAYGYDTSAGSSVGGVLGSVLDTVTDVASGSYGDYYRTSEWIIPLGAPVYVLGGACSGQTGAQIVKSQGKPFIISYKPETELTKKYTWHYVLWWAFGGLLGAGGIAAAVYGAGFMKK
ncbi:MAG: E3 ubiquitin ligase family protein [Actinobacteria bacterium]|nr:E3 ubiquitin ligase family protein [Actinomycetota bacterium]MBU1942606.1 E3 ubiquitin ligase family protein [Actinomycetota bacterium]MBU2688718.1 E3 ubiquitin ligase family protein [Actinomycetota bacterium]